MGISGGPTGLWVTDGQFYGTKWISHQFKFAQFSKFYIMVS